MSTITKKTFEVLQIVENRSEFVVKELFYLFGISIYCMYHGEDYPHKTFNSAYNYKVVLEEKEKKDVISRETTIIFSIAIFITIILLTYALQI